MSAFEISSLSAALSGSRNNPLDLNSAFAKEETLRKVLMGNILICSHFEQPNVVGVADLKVHKRGRMND